MHFLGPYPISFDGNYSKLGEIWGAMSIKYIVVLTNTTSSNFNSASANGLIYGLYNVTGVMEVSQGPGVIVFENHYAKPVVYSNNTNANIDIVSRSPASYKVDVNSSSPFNLILNQNYDKEWIASINGKPILNSEHFKSDDSFNVWQINSTGHFTIELYYRPQTNYLIGVIISMLTFYGASVYLIAITGKSLIKRRKRKML